MFIDRSYQREVRSLLKGYGLNSVVTLWLVNSMSLKNFLRVVKPKSKDEKPHVAFSQLYQAGVLSPRDYSSPEDIRRQVVKAWKPLTEEDATRTYRLCRVAPKFKSTQFEARPPLEHQQKYVDRAVEWAVKAIKLSRNGSLPRAIQSFRFFGYAGVGKTTLANWITSLLVEELAIRPMWMAPTGKAAQNLTNKGVATQTCHSAIYLPRVNEQDGSVSWNLRPELDADMLFIDEGSMVGKSYDQRYKMWTGLGPDMETFNLPMFVLQDPGQLQPIEGEQFWGTDTPEVWMKKVLRQAEDSPILHLATLARKDKELKYGKYKHGDSKASILTEGQYRKKRLDLVGSILESEDAIICCGTNATRQGLNNLCLDLLNLKKDLPSFGTPLMCLKNELPFVNGTLWTTLWSSKPYNRDQVYRDARGNLRVSRWGRDEPGTEGSRVEVEVLDLIVVSKDRAGPPLKVTVPVASFTGEELHWRQKSGMTSFTWGFTGTCHKLQGSEFKKLLLIDESYAFRDSRVPWLYTGISRASTELTLVR